MVAEGGGWTSNTRRSVGRVLPGGADCKTWPARTLCRCRRSPSDRCRSRRRGPRCSPRCSRNQRDSWPRYQRCRRYHLYRRWSFRWSRPVRQRLPCPRRRPCPGQPGACCRLHRRSSREPLRLLRPMRHSARRWHQKRRRYSSQPYPQGSGRTNRGRARCRTQQPSRALPLAIEVIVRGVPRPRPEYGRQVTPGPPPGGRCCCQRALRPRRSRTGGKLCSFFAVARRQTSAAQPLARQGIKFATQLPKVETGRHARTVWLSCGARSKGPPPKRATGSAVDCCATRAVLSACSTSSPTAARTPSLARTFVTFAAWS